MAQCEVLGCTREGTIERHVDAPFTMTSSAAQSVHKILICEVCHEQDKRMKQVARPAAFGGI